MTESPSIPGQFHGAPPASGAPGIGAIRTAYAESPWLPRSRDTASATSADLVEEISAVLAEWTVANRQLLRERLQAAPTPSGFREGLLRLGLKHINDPEFVELLPPDLRRRPKREGSPATPPRA